MPNQTITITIEEDFEREKKSSLAYMERLISEAVHLRGSENFFDLSVDEQTFLKNYALKMMDTMVREQHHKQYGSAKKGDFT